jgi:hypothetical protein
MRVCASVLAWITVLVRIHEVSWICFWIHTWWMCSMKYFGSKKCHSNTHHYQLWSYFYFASTPPWNRQQLPENPNPTWTLFRRWCLRRPLRLVNIKLHRGYVHSMPKCSSKLLHQISCSILLHEAGNVEPWCLVLSFILMRMVAWIRTH